MRFSKSRRLNTRRKNTKLWLWSRQRNCSLMRSGRGQAALEQALREAEAQRREQDTQAEQAAQLRADAIMTEARRACDGLRRQAEERLADAAALIVRRVVGDSCLLSK